jgi:hypothetical protein
MESIQDLEKILPTKLEIFQNDNNFLRAHAMNDPGF